MLKSGRRWLYSPLTHRYREGNFGRSLFCSFYFIFCKFVVLFSLIAMPFTPPLNCPVIKRRTFFLRLPLLKLTYTYYSICPHNAFEYRLKPIFGFLTLSLYCNIDTNHESKQTFFFIKKSLSIIYHCLHIR